MAIISFLAIQPLMLDGHSASCYDKTKGIARPTVVVPGLHDPGLARVCRIGEPLVLGLVGVETRGSVLSCDHALPARQRQPDGCLCITVTVYCSIFCRSVLRTSNRCNRSDTLDPSENSRHLQDRLAPIYPLIAANFIHIRAIRPCRWRQLSVGLQHRQRTSSENWGTQGEYTRYSRHRTGYFRHHRHI